MSVRSARTEGFGANEFDGVGQCDAEHGGVAAESIGRNGGDGQPRIVHCAGQVQMSGTGYDCLTFVIRKGRFGFKLNAPYSAERRKAASELAKKNIQNLQQGKK